MLPGIDYNHSINSIDSYNYVNDIFMIRYKGNINLKNGEVFIIC